MHNFAPSRATCEVLYVQDDPLRALLMQQMFNDRADLKLKIATSGAAALARGHTAPPPVLLLLDLRLRDEEGAALLPLLHTVPGWRAVPMVALAAPDASWREVAGFDDLWPLPLNLKCVLDRLDYWLPCDGAPLRCLPTAQGAGALASARCLGHGTAPRATVTAGAAGLS